MALPHQSYTPNLLLRALAPPDFALLQPSLERIQLCRGYSLFRGGEPIEHLHFLEGGVGSIVSREAGEDVEIGLVGREGFSGVPVLLGSDRTPDDGFIQIDDSSALRIEVGAALEAVAASPELRALLLRYVHVLSVQAGRTAAANASYELPQRLARWLLMCHDRVDGDALVLTHEFMAMMLAVRRSGVTVTLHFIEGTGAIAARRGVVHIIDRVRLEAIAAESYGVPELEYCRLIAPFGRSAAPH
jgi:CRP-like cAMP-binding protein